MLQTDSAGDIALYEVMAAAVHTMLPVKCLNMEFFVLTDIRLVGVLMRDSGLASIEIALPGRWLLGERFSVADYVDQSGIVKQLITIHRGFIEWPYA